MQKIDVTKLNLTEKVIYINRCAKVVKGGRRFSFSAIVATGDGQGYVGVGMGKASEVPMAIKKAIEKARKNLIFLKLSSSTIAFPITAKVGASCVVLRPASRGTGIIAGGPVRVILELAGIKDIITKTIGSSNPCNVAAATLKCLKEIERTLNIRNKRFPEEIKSKTEEKKETAVESAETKEDN